MINDIQCTTKWQICTGVTALSSMIVGSTVVVGMHGKCKMSFLSFYIRSFFISLLSLPVVLNTISHDVIRVLIGTRVYFITTNKTIQPTKPYTCL